MVELYKYYCSPYDKYLNPFFDSYFGLNVKNAVHNAFVAFKNKSTKEISVFNVDTGDVVAEDLEVEQVEFISEQYLLVTIDKLYGVYNVNSASIEIPCKFKRIIFYGDLFICKIEDDSAAQLYVCTKRGLSWIEYSSYHEINCVLKDKDCSVYSAYDGKHYHLFSLNDGEIFALRSFCICEPEFMYGHAYSLSDELICIPECIDEEIIGPQFSEENEQAISEIFKNIDKKMQSVHYIYSHGKEGYGSDMLLVSKCRLGLYQLQCGSFLTMVLPHKYDEIILRNDGMFDIRIENRWGLATKECGEITAVKYKYRVTDIRVVDAVSNLCGVLSNDYKKELISTIYNDIVFANLEYDEDFPEYSIKLPIAVGKFISFKKSDIINDEVSVYFDEKLKYAVLNKKGKIKSDFLYDHVFYYEPKKLIAAFIETEKDTYKLDVYTLEGILNPPIVNKIDKDNMFEMLLYI
jgi:hypothetical protein